MSKRNTSRSQDNKRTHRRTKSQINVVGSKDRSSQDLRSRRRKERLRKKYRRRRIGLVLILALILFFLARFISQAINTYKVPGYPEFRDEVLEAMGEEVFISSSEGRSLSTAEKVTDFDNFFNTIQRNYAVDANNYDDFKEFVSQYDDFRKRVYTSKTDQEYFNIIDQYLDVLDDVRTFVLDKYTYDSLFNYYRNGTGNYRKEVLENPQAVDRYKRLINQASLDKPSMDLSIENEHILRISLADFKPDEFKDDIKEINKALESGKQITSIILDLSDNDSIDYIYRNKLLEILLHEDYEESNLVFYRGDLAMSTLSFIRDNEGLSYSTPFVKNQASKYSGEILSIDLDNYMFYDELRLNIKKDQDYSNRNIYVLTNSNTANEAIKLAYILKKNGAYLVKNSFDSATSHKEVVYNMPSDLYVMEHSGLILSINDGYSKNEGDEKYLNYDEKINSKNPIRSILEIIGQ